MDTEQLSMTKKTIVGVQFLFVAFGATVLVPLLIGMMGFTLASLGCAWTEEIHLFLAFRFLQGLSGAFGIVIARAVARDVVEGPALMQFMALLMMVNGLAPPQPVRDRPAQDLSDRHPHHRHRERQLRHRGGNVKGRRNLRQRRQVHIRR